MTEKIEAPEEAKHYLNPSIAAAIRITTALDKAGFEYNPEMRRKLSEIIRREFDLACSEAAMQYLLKLDDDNAVRRQYFSATMSKDNIDLGHYQESIHIGFRIKQLIKACQWPLIELARTEREKHFASWNRETLINEVIFRTQVINMKKKEITIMRYVVWIQSAVCIGFGLGLLFRWIKLP